MGRSHLRRHWLFLSLMAAGIAIRVVVWTAYRPALLFPDSRTYIDDALHLGLDKLRPSGYSFLLWPLVRIGHLQLVAAVQHLLGLGVAVALYLVMVRRRVPPWAAALATLPVLFDYLQLDLEQYVMSDVLFEALVVAALTLLLWRNRPGGWPLSAAGLLLGCAAVTRSAGLALPVVLLLALVTGRVGWRRAVATLAAFALPVVAYATAFDVHRGRFALSDYDGRYLYARLAPIADCSGAGIPADEQVLCPPQPLGQRYPTNVYMWDLQRSPQYRIGHPSDPRSLDLVSDWDRRILLHQPLGYARIVARDFVRGFAPFRTVGRDDVPLTPWLFQAGYPDNSVGHPDQLLASAGDGAAQVSAGEARWLVAYGRYAHVPGPLLAACLLLGLLAAAGRGRMRRSPARRPAWLASLACVCVLLPAAMASGFSWRYQLPQLALLPLAGVCAVSAALRRAPSEPVSAGTRVEALRRVAVEP